MSAAGGEQATDRVALLRWAAGVGIVSAPAFAVHDGSAVASARARLAAATRCGLLARSAPLRSHPALYTVTRAGLRACGEHDLAPARVTAANAAHAATCALVAAQLERRYPGRSVLGEAALRRHQQLGDESLLCVLGVATPRTATATHRPDLALLAKGSHEAPVAVEVELTVKAPRRLQAICLAWARCGSVAGVLYLASPAAQRAVSRAVALTAAAERIVVVSLEAIGTPGG
jgi:hypothetical protein